MQHDNTHMNKAQMEKNKKNKKTKQQLRAGAGPDLAQEKSDQRQ